MRKKHKREIQKLTKNQHIGETHRTMELQKHQNKNFADRLTLSDL